MSFVVVVGIGTDVGKTVVSSVLVEALKSDYWKPVQAGVIPQTDTELVSSLVSHPACFFPERFRLDMAASPHLAANEAGVMINATDFMLPKTNRFCIIEGAGGIMVPLNDDGLLYLDLISRWNSPVVLVSRHYLGSINHTLLTISQLKLAGISISLLVFVGDEYVPTESIIKKLHPELPVHRIPLVDEITKSFVMNEALRIDVSLFD